MQINSQTLSQALTHNPLSREQKDRIKGAITMPEEKTQINFQTTTTDAEAIDALARADGYDNRSAWVRAQLRKVIDTRRTEIVTVTTLPRPEGAQAVPVVSVYAAEA